MLRKVSVAAAMGLMLSACANVAATTSPTAPATINLANAQATLKALQPGVDAVAAAVLADTAATATFKTQVGAADAAFDAAVTAFAAANSTANLASLVSTLETTANAVVATLPLTTEQKTDLSLALSVVDALVAAAPAVAAAS